MEKFIRILRSSKDNENDNIGSGDNILINSNSIISKTFLLQKTEIIFLLIIFLLLILVKSVFGQGNERWDDRFDALGMNSVVYAIADNDSEVFAGGEFSTAGGISAANVAMWDGINWSALGSGVNGGVWAIAVMGSDVYVGGEFTTAGGASANYIARWDGSSWSALGSGVNNNVRAIAVNGSDVYIGGEFTQAGGTSANYIARWDGSSWSTLGSGVGSIVRAIAVNGSNVYVGGEFTTAGGSSANYIAKWDGSGWSALGSGLNNNVWAITVNSSNVYVGGEFTTAGGSSANYIAMWDGSGWSTLGSGVDNTVLALTVTDSDVYAAGDFTNAGGSSADYIAGWLNDAWQNLGDGLNVKAWTLALTADEKELFVGGEFTTAGNENSNYIGRWFIHITRTWMGSLSQGWWHLGANWSPAGVPADTENVVIIPGSPSSAPIIVTDNPAAVCNSLLLKENGFLTVNNSRNLTVNGDLQIGGDNDVNDGVLTLNSSSTLSISGNYIKKDRSTLNGGSGTIIFGDIQDQQIISGGVASEDAFNNLQINKSSGVVSLGEEILMNGQVQITSGSFNSNNYDITLGGSWINAGTFLAGSETVTLNSSSGSFTVTANGSAFNNLILNSGATYQLGSALDVDGDLTISSGTLDANGFNLNVGGNWNNAGTFNAGTGMVTFNGSGDQSINSGGTGSGKLFDNLTANKSSGSVLLLSTVDIDGNLTISSGDFNLNGQTLEFGDEGTDVISVSGILNLDDFSDLHMYSGSSISVNSGGILRVLGSSLIDGPVVTQLGSGNYSIDVLSGGTIDAQYATFEYTGGNGIRVQNGATIASTSKFDNSVFQYGSGNAYLTIANSQNLTVSGVRFENGPTYNVDYTGSGGIAFSNYTGPLSGVNFESDNGSGTRGNVRWYFTQTENVDGESQTFGNDVILTTPDNLGDVSVTLVDNVLPIAWASVARFYTLQSQNSGVGLSTLRLYYGQSELGEEVELDLVVWQRRNGGWTNLGGSVNTLENFVEITGGGYNPVAATLDTLILSDAQQDLALPVELTTFIAYIQGDHIVLEWKTESEIENAFWLIERKWLLKDEYEQIKTGELDLYSTTNPFNKIAQIDGQGSKSSSTDYQYIDEQVEIGEIYAYRIADVSFHGVVTYHPSIFVTWGNIPQEYHFAQNYPNPFNPNTFIEYSLPVASQVLIKIYNILGQEVVTLVDEQQLAGIYKMEWDGTNFLGQSLPSGTYIYQIQAVSVDSQERFINRKKMILMR